jgi:hypothetical protein
VTRFKVKARTRKGSHILTFALGRRFLTFEIDPDKDLIICYSNRNLPIDKLTKVKVIYFSKLLKIFLTREHANKP